MAMLCTVDGCPCISEDSHFLVARVPAATLCILSQTQAVCTNNPIPGGCTWRPRSGFIPAVCVSTLLGYVDCVSCSHQEAPVQSIHSVTAGVGCFAADLLLPVVPSRMVPCWLPAVDVNGVSAKSTCVMHCLPISLVTQLLRVRV